MSSGTEGLRLFDVWRFWSRIYRLNELKAWSRIYRFIECTLYIGFDFCSGLGQIWPEASIGELEFWECVWICQYRMSKQSLPKLDMLPPVPHCNNTWWWSDSRRGLHVVGPHGWEKCYIPNRFCFIHHMTLINYSCCFPFPEGVVVLFGYIFN